MNQLPAALLESLDGLPGYDRDAFISVHAAGAGLSSIRINPFKQTGDTVSVTGLQPGQLSPVPWSRYGYYLAERPSFTFDPFFHAGAYYVQEASSMFLEQALMAHADLQKPLRVLDACASPGGKSTHILSLISADSLLVSNEVIRQRSAVLRDNIVKWGVPNVVVTQNDPSHFTSLPSFFDVLVVDAPCSGSGLFRRDPEAIQEWSENNVALCSQRQQRILSDLLPALRDGGLLIYSTCSYSAAEDEQITEWLKKEHDLELLSVPVKEDWQITASQGGYRFWPNRVRGEGFFLVCLRKKGEEPVQTPKKGKTLAKASAAMRLAASPFIKDTDAAFLLHENDLLLWPAAQVAAMEALAARLYIVMAGVQAGEIIRDKLIPAHGLSQSVLLKDSVPFTELSYPLAIAYLQRKDMGVETTGKGWQTVRYGGLPLGWINALPGRINNYYPAGLRILKDS